MIRGGTVAFALGAVLTVAAAAESLRGALLLAAFAAGMATFLFPLAAVWERLDLGNRRPLHGRESSFGPLSLHRISLFPGAAFAALGVAFIPYEGTSALEGIHAETGAMEIAPAVREWARGTTGTVVGAALVLALVPTLCGAFAGRFGNAEKGR